MHFTPFGVGTKPGCSTSLHAGIIENHKSFVLRRILVKFHIRTRLIESFPTTFRKRKVALHTNSHLTSTEAWWSTVSTTWDGRRVLSEVWLENYTQDWEWAKFEERGTHGWGKIVLHTCFDLSILVRTYPQHSDQVRSSHNVNFCPFECSCSSVLRRTLLKLYVLTHLIKSFPMVHGLWRCIEIEMLIPLGAHA